MCHRPGGASRPPPAHTRSSGSVPASASVHLTEPQRPGVGRGGGRVSGLPAPSLRPQQPTRFQVLPSRAPPWQPLCPAGHPLGPPVPSLSPAAVLGSGGGRTPHHRSPRSHKACGTGGRCGQGLLAAEGLRSQREPSLGNREAGLSCGAWALSPCGLVV